MSDLAATNSDEVRDAGGSGMLGVSESAPEPGLCC